MILLKNIKFYSHDFYNRKIKIRPLCSKHVFSRFFKFIFQKTKNNTKILCVFLKSQMTFEKKINMKIPTFNNYELF